MGSSALLIDKHRPDWFMAFARVVHTFAFGWGTIHPWVIDVIRKNSRSELRAMVKPKSDNKAAKC